MRHVLNSPYSLLLLFSLMLSTLVVVKTSWIEQSFNLIVVAGTNRKSEATITVENTIHRGAILK